MSLGWRALLLLVVVVLATRVPLLVLTVGGGYYVIRCAGWPLRKCLWCRGKRVLQAGVGGRRMSLRRRRVRPCRRCGGTGQGVYIGRQIFDKVNTSRRRAR